jgi:succinate-semialdehyde dehydrogenase / glutarate-semialdehyde dehydrogenase
MNRFVLTCCIDPANNQELGTIPEMGVTETKEAIEAAQKAFESWSKTSAKTRHDLLLKLFGLMNEHQEDLARIMVSRRLRYDNVIC